MDRGETKELWERSTKYKGVRYINNTALNKNNIPIVNLLEFSKKGNRSHAKHLMLAYRKLKIYLKTI